MDIIEYLDEEADAKVTFEEEGELGDSVLKFTQSDGPEIRVYPYGIEKLKKVLDFIENNNLIKG